jgi:hypothetical protein
MNKKEKSDLRARTKVFALRMIRLYSSLPNLTQAQARRRQTMNDE